MPVQICDTQINTYLFINPNCSVSPVVKLKLPTLLPKGIRWRLAGCSFPTFPTSEGKSPFYPGKEPGIHQNEASIKSLDTLFLETMRRVQPAFPIHEMTQQNILGALKIDPELMDRFIEELLSKGNLEIRKPCRNPILDLIIRHPDTVIRSSAQELVVGLREGYLLSSDCLQPPSPLPLDDR